MSRAELQEQNEHLRNLLDDARKRVEILEIAVRWALGELVPGAQFLPREPGQAPYWWRRELRQRAGMGSRPAGPSRQG